MSLPIRLPPEVSPYPGRHRPKSPLCRVGIRRFPRKQVPEKPRPDLTSDVDIFLAANYSDQDLFVVWGRENLKAWDQGVSFQWREEAWISLIRRS